MINAYLAGGIFTEKDVMYLNYLANAIRGLCPELNLYVPHENKEINDKTKCADSYDIYKVDMERLKNTDLLIAVVSGDMPPIGTTCEIGIFSQMQEEDNSKHLVALYDDCRNGSTTFSEEKVEKLKSGVAENQWHYINLFLVGCIKTHGVMVTSSKTLFNVIEKERDWYRSLNKPGEVCVDMDTKEIKAAANEGMEKESTGH